MLVYIATSWQTYQKWRTFMLQTICINANKGLNLQRKNILHVKNQYLVKPLRAAISAAIQHYIDSNRLCIYTWERAFQIAFIGTQTSSVSGTGWAQRVRHRPMKQDGTDMFNRRYIRWINRLIKNLYLLSWKGYIPKKRFGQALLCWNTAPGTHNRPWYSMAP